MSFAEVMWRRACGAVLGLFIFSLFCSGRLQVDVLLSARVIFVFTFPLPFVFFFEPKLEPMGFALQLSLKMKFDAYNFSMRNMPFCPLLHRVCSFGLQPK